MRYLLNFTVLVSFASSSATFARTEVAAGGSDKDSSFTQTVISQEENLGRAKKCVSAKLSQGLDPKLCANSNDFIVSNDELQRLAMAVKTRYIWTCDTINGRTNCYWRTVLARSEPSQKSKSLKVAGGPSYGGIYKPNGTVSNGYGPRPIGGYTQTTTLRITPLEPKPEKPGY
jgi:hypothetical protein